MKKNGMNKIMEIINNTNQELWNDVISNVDGSTYFHTYEWAKIIEQTFQNYSIATKVFIFDDDVTAILPLIQIKRFFGLKKYYYSMVPGVYGGILSNDKLTSNQINDIYKYVLNECAQLSVVGNPFLQQHIPIFFTTTPMFTHVLDLENKTSTDIKSYSKSHRRAIIKAKKQSVYFRIGKTLKDYKEYYNIYLDSLKRWGDKATSKYKFKLFKNIYNLKSNNIKLFLALVDDKIISGALIFYCGEHVVYWHGSTLSDYLKYYPSKFLQYEIIKDSYEKGYKYYDFNPSGGHKGVIQFKEGFGAEKKMFELCTVRKR